MRVVVKKVDSHYEIAAGNLQHPAEFSTYQAAQKLLNAVEKAGKIDPSLWTAKVQGQIMDDLRYMD